MCRIPKNYLDGARDTLSEILFSATLDNGDLSPGSYAQGHSPQTADPQAGARALYVQRESAVASSDQRLNR